VCQRARCRARANKSLVNAETRERIQAIAREHGFRPNQMASKLRTQRSNVIGVVVPLGHERRQHISDPFFMTLLGHLADGLTENGYDLMLSRVVPDSDDWLDRIVDSGMLEGVLLIGQSNVFDTIERVAADYLPLVVWGEHRPGQVHCAVGSDNRTGGRLAAQQLIDRGCRRLAYLGDVQPPEIFERFIGAQEAARAAGLDEIEILSTPLAADAMQSTIAEHIARLGDGIDGIIAASDVVAMTVIRALADHDISVPDAVAVVGFDDLAIATQTVPRLTTVRQDIERGAREMVDALFKRIAGNATQSVVMKPELIVRDSA
jgi:DNA-binding LacI/PurR family transcriptional regulator